MHPFRTIRPARPRPVVPLLALAVVAALASVARAGDEPPAGAAATFPWSRYGTAYVGVGGGLGRYGDHTDANDDGSLSGIDAKDNGTSWRLRAGFEGRYGGGEVGFVDLGRSEFSATSAGGPSWVAGDVTARVESQGWLWTAFARYPIVERWAALVRVGGFTWTSTETFTENGFESGDEDSGTSLTFGFGLEYDIHRLSHTVLRTEWDRFVVDEDELPVNSFSIGADYHF
jgi:hypothetical protein